MFYESAHCARSDNPIAVYNMSTKYANYRRLSSSYMSANPTNDCERLQLLPRLFMQY